MKTSLTTAQFNYLIKNSEVFICDNMKFYFKFSKKEALGFIVNKKLGSAVERNRFKRKCRSLYSMLLKNHKKKLNLIVYPQCKLNEDTCPNKAFDSLFLHLNHG